MQWKYYTPSTRELEKVIQLLLNEVCSSNTRRENINIEVVEEIVPSEGVVSSEAVVPPTEVHHPYELDASEEHGDMDVDLDVSNAQVHLEEHLGQVGQEVPLAEEATPTNKPEVKCSVCGKTLASVASLKRHVAIFHGDNVNKCETCGKFFATSKELELHKMCHTGFECKLCGKPYNTADSLRTHIYRKHKNGDSGDSANLTCDICQKQYKNIDSLRVHKKNKHSETREENSEVGVAASAD